MSSLGRELSVTQPRGFTRAVLSSSTSLQLSLRSEITSHPTLGGVAPQWKQRKSRCGPAPWPGPGPRGAGAGRGGEGPSAFRGGSDRIRPDRPLQEQGFHFYQVTIGPQQPPPSRHVQGLAHGEGPGPPLLPVLGGRLGAQPPTASLRSVWPRRRVKVEPRHFHLDQEHRERISGSDCSRARFLGGVICSRLLSPCSQWGCHLMC